MDDSCAKHRVTMVDLSHSVNYKEEKTFSLSDMSSARSVPKLVRYHMNNSASTKEMAEMIDEGHWKV